MLPIGKEIKRKQNVVNAQTNKPFFLTFVFNQQFVYGKLLKSKS